MAYLRLGVRACSIVKALGAIASVLALTACDDEPQASPDVLDAASVVRCDMPADHACREYRRVTDGGFDTFVNLSEARSSCALGWPNGTGQAGAFAEEECATEAALARCRLHLGYIAIDFFYEGFADTETLRDPIAWLNEACESVGGSLEQPPFP